MLKGTADRCSFSSVCGTMFHIAYRGVSIHTNADITDMFECRAICNAHFCLNGTHIYDDKYKMYNSKCSDKYIGTVASTHSIGFLGCRYVVWGTVSWLLWGFSGLNLLRELYVRKIAWPYFYDSLAYAIIAQAE